MKEIYGYVVESYPGYIAISKSFQNCYIPSLTRDNSFLGRNCQLIIPEY